MANTAAAIEINDDVLDFETAVRRTTPYLHVVSPRFYTEKFAETLLEWLESGATWRLKETVLFKQYELGFGNFKHCAEIQGLWDPGCLPVYAMRQLARLAFRFRGASISRLTSSCRDSTAVFIPTTSRARRIGWSCS